MTKTREEIVADIREKGWVMVEHVSGGWLVRTSFGPFIICITPEEVIDIITEVVREDEPKTEPGED